MNSILISDQSISKGIFNLLGKNRIELPRGTRTYIDSCAHEFNFLTIEQKLCYLGFAINRGMNLYSKIKKSIDDHSSYFNYEGIAKESLLSYIEYLRQDEEYSLVNFFYDQIDNLDLKKLVNLLEEEILLRYRERVVTEGHEYVVYFVSIPVNHSTILERIKANSNDKKIYYDYLLTSKETISNALISRDYIEYLNRWKELRPKLSGDHLYFSEDLVFPGDEELVYAYNASQRDNMDKQLVLRVPPEPWSGNILNSKLVLLSLNPGYVEYLNKSLANMFNSQMAEAIMQDKRLVLSMDGDKFDYHEPTRILGEYYWRKNISPLGIAVHGEQDKEKIFDQVSLCQYLAYTSPKSPTIKELLPSQKFTKMVLLHLATARDDVKFLVLRASSQWKALMGDGLWNYLLENNRLLISEHYRSQCVSEKNIGAENYKIIVDYLKNS